MNVQPEQLLRQLKVLQLKKKRNRYTNNRKENGIRNVLPGKYNYE